MSISYFYRFRRRISNELLARLQTYGFKSIQIPLRFIISGSVGLFIFDQGRITKLLSGNFFGITFLDSPDLLLATRYVQNGTFDERSTLHIIRLSGNSVVEETPFICIRNKQRQWPARIHQIKYHNGSIWITNTRQNVLWQCNLEGTILREWTESSRIDYDHQQPQTITKKARTDPDYHHYNSLTFSDNYLHVLAHNSAGEDKSKKSYSLTLDDRLNIVHRQNDIGVACHDILILGDRTYICNSGEQQLLMNGHAVAQFDRFTRGLIEADGILVIGGTAFSKSDAERRDLNSKLFFLDRKDHRTIAELTLGRVGAVHDLLLYPHARV